MKPSDPIAASAVSDVESWEAETDKFHEVEYGVDGTPPPEYDGNGKVPPAAEPSYRVRALTATEMMREPRPVAIVEGVAWRGCITVLVAESSGGKTFVTLGIAAAIVDGSPWHGRRVRRGSVVYLSFEGDALGLRLMALHEAGYSLGGLHLIRATETLSPHIERDGAERPSIGEMAVTEELARIREALQSAGKPPIVLVIIDTVRASLAGSEDSSEDVSAYLRAARRIMSVCPDAGCILAHHSGWQDGEARRKRERGSSAFRGNADATLYLEVVEEDAEQHLAYLALKALKVRDEERPAPLRLVRRRVAVSEMDEHGEPRTTCVIERDPRSREDVDAAEATRKAEAEADLERRAVDAIAQNEVTSIASLRALLKCSQPIAADLLARLQATGRIGRKSQRESYRVVPSRTGSQTGKSRESYRTARPKGGTSTTRPVGGKKEASRTGRGGRK